MPTDRPVGLTFDRVGALRRERAELLRLCRELDVDEWHSPSAAPGWRVQDVVAHLGSSCHALFSPAALQLMRSKDIERANDVLVDQRREWTPAQTLAEYERWSNRVAGVVGAASRTPLGKVHLPLAELGRFPFRQFLGAMVFDHHTHLRHDIAPALGRPVPDTDATRMAVVLEWMMAVLRNQLRTARPGWLDRPVALALSGPGGGRWVFGPEGGVDVETSTTVAAQIDGSTVQFPQWATRRADWRGHDLRVTGDIDYGTTFLDAVNVV
jgi:uncharacterized protein (TIGR03083 family)